jgi:hypothetical protein
LLEFIVLDVQEIAGVGQICVVDQVSDNVSVPFTDQEIDLVFDCAFDRIVNRVGDEVFIIQVVDQVVVLVFH